MQVYKNLGEKENFGAFSFILDISPLAWGIFLHYEGCSSKILQLRSPRKRLILRGVSGLLLICEMTYCADWGCRDLLLVLVNYCWHVQVQGDLILKVIFVLGWFNLKSGFVVGMFRGLIWTFTICRSVGLSNPEFISLVKHSTWSFLDSFTCRLVWLV